MSEIAQIKGDFSKLPPKLFNSYEISSENLPEETIELRNVAFHVFCGITALHGDSQMCDLYVSVESFVLAYNVLAFTSKAHTISDI